VCLTVVGLSKDLRKRRHDGREPRMTAADLVEKPISDEHADVLHDSVAWLITQLMEAEVAG
jgi:hypothetical protein